MLGERRPRAQQWGLSMLPLRLRTQRMLGLHALMGLLLLRRLLVEWVTSVIHHREPKRRARALALSGKSSNPFKREACKGAVIKSIPS